ncbi:hypothetical protein Ddye_003256 [Dipteronia dyeriana]|uniref:Aminotransferase class V domain-containing protein n=1 Tax=Dipteronia dyeriana TaxID=168575 RepID=A0AAD9XT46_9ROSI|nr:hypothetical protein Ddye_003256 [Dipteronia dyeriana]
MHSTYNQREAWCHGCCPNPFVGQPDHQSQRPPAASMSTAAAARNEFEIVTTRAIFSNPHEFTNHESLPSLHESFSNFTKVFPHYSHQTDKVDQIREQDYFHLSLSKHVSFDYIGHGLFSYSQLKRHYSKPLDASSSSSSSLSSPPLFSELEEPFFDIFCKSSLSLNSWMKYGGEESELESGIRKRIMAFMNISEEDYTMVFTANQSCAFKLLAESYPFHSNRKLVTVYDYENEAVQVMSESSKKRGARVMSAEFSWPDLTIQSRKLMKKIMGKRKKRSKRGLFVFPIQSRMSGARYSYMWMSLAQEHGWHVLLDASALGPKDMDTLGLFLFKPDFIFCSLYKIFGENPSGFGCLFIKKSNASLFKDSTAATGIGIVNLVPSMTTYQFTENSTIAHIETEQKRGIQKDDHDVVMVATEPEKPIQKYHRELSFSEILDSETPHDDFEQARITKGKTELECKGLDHADSLGLIVISNRVRYLINWLVHALMSLQHPYSENRLPLVRIYGPKVMFERGPAVAFNVFDWNGDKIDPALLQRLADRYNISLSYGFLHHIWFSDKHEEEKKKVLETRAATGDVTGLNKGGEAHAVRSGISVVTATLGLLTNFEDIYRLWAFVSLFLDADFVQKERWRYLALNQQTIEI